MGSLNKVRSVLTAMQEDDGGNEIGLGEVYKSFEEMQNVYDKLQLLKYENGYLKLMKLPPLHRYYFIVARNPGEQFHNFVSLSSWLIQECGRNIKMPSESEDPNTVICRILAIVREMGAVLDFSPSRVKSGCGPDVVSVLDFLTDKAILKKEHEWEIPVIPPDKIPEVEEDAHKQVISLDKVEDDIEISEDSDCEDDDNEVPNTGKEHTNVLNSETTRDEWLLELETVLPQLKSTVKSSTLDWRWRLAEMQTLTNNVTESIGELESPISKVISEAESVTEAVRNRETYLSGQFGDRLNDLHEIAVQVSQMRERAEIQQKEIKNKTRLLTSTEEKLRACKKKLDDCSTLISEGAPVAVTRQALEDIKLEKINLEIQIAVLEHCRFKKKDEELVIEMKPDTGGGRNQD